MLNTLSTLVFDVAGHVEINVTPETTTGQTRRRVNRVATLDGGAVVNDGGFSDADRNLELAWLNEDNPGADELVDRLVQFYTRLQVSTRAGVFLAVLEAFTPGASVSKVRLLVIEKLSA